MIIREKTSSVKNTSIYRKQLSLDLQQIITESNSGCWPQRMRFLLFMVHMLYLGNASNIFFKGEYFCHIHLKLMRANSQTQSQKMGSMAISSVCVYIYTHTSIYSENQQNSFFSSLLAFCSFHGKIFLKDCQSVVILLCS